MTEPPHEDPAHPVLRTLHRGQIVTGTVIEIASFGVTFVDIGGLTAVINIPELSWRPINHPSDIVTVGKEVTAEILDVDPERRRVALSLKALQNDPLVQLQQRIGKTFTGPVTKLVPFGAFVRVEDRTDSFEGLVHSAELADIPLQVGYTLTVKIARIDTMRRRIELNLTR
ncbi:S1 RNA-binding domain-containing protein [Actinoallomurus purpureus]|uniref:S1 RNA-binding domain-containing protein n=1 Tax=Actinoallomurus purpureus TaxID=478114 RepID=UPI00209223BB|nr:S1 RNA-binding domain-containing protein [Actinoallomurus purpureus]MCO6003919.1 S1 RNA-binding domain-containing protein [Actinoallomurus purpureus]